MTQGSQRFERGGFSFRTRSTLRIGNSNQYEEYADKLGIGNISLPEMLYVDNFLEIEHNGALIRFDAFGALKSWHEEQKKKDPNVNIQNFDWTYSNYYNGDIFANFSLTETEERPNMDLLTARIPILFFSSIPLYTSDLDDNGEAEASVKIRVMEDFAFILCRSFFRLDRTRVWLRDVRYFIPFSNSDRESKPSKVLRWIEIRDVPLAVPNSTQLPQGNSYDESPLPSFFTSTPLEEHPVMRAHLNGSAGASTHLAVSAVENDLPALSSEVTVFPRAPTALARKKIHPVVLASMREKAALLGQRLRDDGSVIRDGEPEVLEEVIVQQEPDQPVVPKAPSALTPQLAFNGTESPVLLPLAANSDDVFKLVRPREQLYETLTWS